MGWLPQLKVPIRYDPVWLQKAIESIRTAINFKSYRTCSGSPVGSVTPEYVGEEILDTVNIEWYKSYGTTVTEWKALTVITYITIEGGA